MQLDVVTAPLTWVAEHARAGVPQPPPAAVVLLPPADVVDVLPTAVVFPVVVLLLAVEFPLP
jgi:hypothetical protein